MLKREISIIVPYINDLSVNHYLGKRKGGGWYVKQEVKDWKEALGWQIKTAHLEDWKLPLTVTCNGMFRDNRRCPDLHNLSKVVLDAIEDTCGVNDRFMKWRCGSTAVKKDEQPQLMIAIKEG